MHVTDIGQAVRFFTETLGFQALFRAGLYAYVHRETVGFRLLQQTGVHAAPPGTRRVTYYIDVHDVDLFYEQVKPKLDALPYGDVYGPVNQSYGQRELLVLAPDGNLIAFGHAIGEN